MKYLEEIKEILSLKELRIFPSYLAYNFVLAIIPTFTIIVLIMGIFSLSTDSLIDLIRNNIPSNIADIIVNLVSSKNYSLGVGFLNITTLYISSRGMYAVIEASNSLYNVGKKKYIGKRLKSVAILFLLILSLLFLILIPVLGSKVLSLLSNHKLIAREIVLIYKVLKWPLTFLFIYINVKLIYIIAPSIKIKPKDVTLGAFTTTIGWSVFTAIFEYYLRYFSKYDILYGGLSSIAVLLIWLYFLGYILILGIVINTRKYNKK